MLKREGGRTRTLRTDEEEIELLLAQYQKLTPEERALLEQMLEDKDMLESAFELEYEHPLPTPAEFLSDPFFAGNVPLYPRLQEEFVDFQTGGYQEMILTGSLGWGKGYLTCVSLSYDLLRFRCARIPQQMFELSPSSLLLMFAFSTSLDQVTQGLGFEFRSMLGQQPWIRETFPFKGSATLLKFPKNIRFGLSSEAANHTLGLNPIGGGIDETNFHSKTRGHSMTMIAGASAKDRIDALYSSIKRRFASRLNVRGGIAAHLYLISSKTTTGSFTERRVTASENDPTVKVLDFANYETAPVGKLSKETFSVFAGTEYMAPQLLLTPEARDAIPTEAIDRIYDNVPVDFLKLFIDDIEGALKDILGVSLAGGGRFIRLRDRIPKIQDGRPNPFSHPYWICGDARGHFIKSLLATSAQEKLRGGITRTRWTPIKNPSHPRVVHIDLSKSDLPTGLAMGHVDRWYEVTRRDPISDADLTEIMPIIYIDVAMQILPPTGGEIDPAKIRGLVYELRALGYNIIHVSMDQFQSHEPLMRFNDEGIETSVVSVESDRRPYDMTKRAVYEGRLKVHECPVLVKELAHVEEEPGSGKIIRPLRFEDGTRATKDVADAVSAVVMKLETIRPNMHVMDMPSSPETESTTDDMSWLTGGALPVGFEEA